MYRNNWPLMALARFASGVPAYRPESGVLSGMLSDVGHNEELAPSTQAEFSSLLSGFASLPVFVLLKDFLTK